MVGLTRHLNNVIPKGFNNYSHFQLFSFPIILISNYSHLQLFSSPIVLISNYSHFQLFSFPIILISIYSHFQLFSFLIILISNYKVLAMKYCSFAWIIIMQLKIIITKCMSNNLHKLRNMDHATSHYKLQSFGKKRRPSH